MHHSISPFRILLAGFILAFFLLTAFAVGKLGLLSGPRTKWRVHIGSVPQTRIDAPVAVAEGKVFVAAGERTPGRYPWNETHYLQALYAADGRFIWHFETDPHGVTGRKPVVQNGKVFFVSTGSYMYALDTVTGVPEWKIRTGREAGDPIIKDDVLYSLCKCAEYADSYDPWGTLWAIDPRSGTIKWSNGLQDPAPTSPVLTTNIIYYEDSNGLHAAERATGQARWFLASDHSITSPPVATDSTVYIGRWMENKPALLALDGQSGKERWHAILEKGSIETLAVGKDSAYVGISIRGGEFGFWPEPQGYLYAIDLHDRRVKWRLDDGPGSGPALEDHGTVYFATYYTLYAIEEASGNVMWKFSRGGGLQAPTVADGVLYIGDGEGDLYALLVP